MKKYKILLISAVAIIVLFLGFKSLRSYLENQKYLRLAPTTGDITEAIYGLGKVKSDQRYEVKVGVLSQIKKVSVKEGDFVHKDQLLLTAEQAHFRAPFAGTVTLISVYEGELASPQTVLVRVENLEDRYIELSLEQDASLRIQKNQKAKVSFESLRGKTMEATVTAIFPRGSEFVTRLDVANLDQKILPGMSADVSIEIGKIQGTLIPFKALRNGIVKIERDGKIQNLKVDVGLIDGLSAEIKGDTLKSTDLVLVPKD